MIMNSLPTFSLFSQLMAKDCGWPFGLPILDFGCNHGNLIRSSKALINPVNYTGIDIDKEAIEIARGDFPLANWIHYNRANHLYNPNGDSSLPELPQKYAAIVSYSVFTQMSYEDKFEIIEHLIKNHLVKNGEFWFTFCNEDNDLCKKFFYNRRTNCDTIQTEDYVYLVDEKTTKELPDFTPEHFITFYNKDFLLAKLAAYSPTFFEAPRGWVQDVIKLKLK